MDFARCSDESKESENCSCIGIGKVEAEAEIVELRVPIEPSTPDADRESCDFGSDSKSKSPLTLLLTCVDSLGERVIEAAPLKGLDSVDPVDFVDPIDPLCSPSTPKDGVFDPFSPGPSHLALAPITRKHFSCSVGSVARRLHFGSSSSSSLQLVEAEEEQSISDSELLEAVYESLLEVIVFHQAEESLAQLSSSQTDCPDCITPPASLISGVAQTCPAAPAKPSRKILQKWTDANKQMEVLLGLSIEVSNVGKITKNQEVGLVAVRFSFLGMGIIMAALFSCAGKLLITMCQLSTMTMGTVKVGVLKAYCLLSFWKS